MSGKLACESRTRRLGNLYVTDYQRIRRIRPNGTVTTVAGQLFQGYTNGAGSVAVFAVPTSLCVDSNGVLYVAEEGNNAILKIILEDWDEDGVPDDLERNSSVFVLGVDDRRTDSDSDGSSNSAEFAAGTDPASAQSQFRIVRLIPGAGQMQVEWTSVTNRSYWLERSVNLVDWEAVNPRQQGIGSPMVGVDTAVGGESRRFYRVVVGSTD